MTPPLAFTQAKYAFAMFAMSVKAVPGWLVSIAPSGIGVPVAATPGLVPHGDVLTVAVLGVLDAVAALACGATRSCRWYCCYCYCSQPAAARAMAAASTIVLRADRPGTCIFISPPRGGEFQVI